MLYYLQRFYLLKINANIEVEARSRSPASGIMGPDAPRWARNAGNTPVGLVPGPARGVHPYNRTADYVDPAAPQHQPSAPSLESRRGASSANGSSTQAYTPDTSASGSARDGSQYNAKYKVEHMVETWMSHAEVIAITKDRGKTPSLDAYKSDRQVKDKKFRRDLGHRRIRLFIQEFNNLNAKRRANGEKEEPAKPKCNAKGWMDDATAMGDYFLSGSGKKSGSSTTMRTADAAEDDDEEYEDDGEEDHE